MSTKPKCIIVTGRAGAGKTTLSKKLGARLWMPVISRDEIKEGYVNTFGVKHDQLPNDTDLVVTNLFFDLVNQYPQGQGLSRLGGSGDWVNKLKAGASSYFQ